MARRLTPTSALAALAVLLCAAPVAAQTASPTATPVHVYAFDAPERTTAVASALVTRLQAHGAHGELLVDGPRLWLVTSAPVKHVGDLLTTGQISLAPVLAPPGEAPTEMPTLPDAEDETRRWAVQISRGLSPNIVEVEARISRLGRAEVQMTFDAAGAKAFEALTRELTGQLLAIVVDGRVLSAPKVMEPIAGGRVVVTMGDGGLEAAERLATRLRGGPLPAKVTLAEQHVGQRIDDAGRTRVTGPAQTLDYATPPRWNATACRISGRTDCAVVMVSP